MKKEKFVKVCPKCGSTNVKIPNAGLDISMSIPDMCIECNNRGIFSEVNIKGLESFRKKLKITRTEINI